MGTGLQFYKIQPRLSSSGREAHMMASVLKTITKFFSYNHYRQRMVEDYLGQSSSLQELERRQQHLARKGIY